MPIWTAVNELHPGIFRDLAVDNVIKSCARLYHLYTGELKGTGKVSMRMSTSPKIPQMPTNACRVDAANSTNEFNLGAFVSPLF